MGDAVNHAIFTFDELDGGLARLDRAGLVTFSDARFHPTTAAIELLARASEGERYAYDVLRAVQTSLGASDTSGRSVTRDPAWTAGAFTAEDVHTAFLAYREKFEEELKKLRERNP